MNIGLSDGISKLDTTLFVIELSRIGVCRFLSTDGAASLRKEELTSGKFVLCHWFCECPAILYFVYFLCGIIK